MKLAIVGSRTFSDYELLKSEVSKLKDIDLIVSGGAVGADSLGARYAEEFGIELQVFRPDYKQFGRAAPFIRNSTIVENSDTVLAFHNGVSTGTLDTINKAKKLKKEIIIVKF